MSRRRWAENAAGLVFSLPALVLLGLFLIFPAGMALYYSFTDFYLLMPEQTKWIGLDQYKHLTEDRLFFQAFKNTVYFTALIVPLQTAAALGLAILINQPLRFVRFFRAAYFSPVIMSMVVVSILWTFLYNPDRGLINAFLTKLGFSPLEFLTSPDQAMNSIIFMSIWQGVGYQMMIFLAGLQDIPKHLYEAASIDGASGWRKFVHVTLPGLRNIAIFVVVITTIQAFKLFIQPMIMTQGGPLDSTKTLVYLIYETGFKFRDVGYSSAIAIVFFLIVLVISIVQRKVITEDRG